VSVVFVNGNFLAYSIGICRYRTIADRLLHMSLVPSHSLVKRDVSYEFMNRQMVWHAFTVSLLITFNLPSLIKSCQEFLLFLLPLLNARSFRRRLSRLTSHINVPTSIPSIAKSILGASSTTNEHGEGGVQRKRGKYWSLPRDQCAICAENASFPLNLSEPVNAFTSLTTATVPGMDSSTSASERLASPELDPSSKPPTHPLNTSYITSCGHIYCYHCLVERMMRIADDRVDEGGWVCLRCGEGVKDAERWVGDVIEEQEDGSEWDGDGSSSISDFESGTDMSASGSLGYSISDQGLSE
jgi:peroxin-2